MLLHVQVMASHYERVQQLQRLFFKHVPKLQELALANCGTGAGRRGGGGRWQGSGVYCRWTCWLARWPSRDSETAAAAALQPTWTTF